MSLRNIPTALAVVVLGILYKKEIISGGVFFAVIAALAAIYVIIGTVKFVAAKKKTCTCPKCGGVMRGCTDVEVTSSDGWSGGFAPKGIRYGHSVEKRLGIIMKCESCGHTIKKDQ